MYHSLKRVHISISAVALFLLPCFVYAQDAVTEARGFMEAINEAILFPLIALMMAVALLVFMWGAFEYVRGADNDQAREQGKKHLLFGVIGLLVMISALSILIVAANTFGLRSEIDNARSGTWGDDTPSADTPEIFR